MDRTIDRSRDGQKHRQKQGWTEAQTEDGQRAEAEIDIEMESFHIQISL